MMEWIRQYVLSITTCAIICSIAKSIVPKGGMSGTIIKLIAGLLVVFTAIKPLSNLHAVNFSEYIDNFSAASNIYTEAGQDDAKNAMMAIIKQQTEAYILDKAASLHTDIAVNVLLNTERMTPSAIEIDGDVSPYAREVLCLYMEDSLGVPKEKQIWN